MDQLKTLVKYRDITTTDSEILAIDSEHFVIGLQAQGIKPLEARTDGRKVFVYFLREEASEPLQKMQASLAGVIQPGLMVDLNLIFSSQIGWKGLLTMMRNVTPISRS